MSVCDQLFVWALARVIVCVGVWLRVVVYVAVCKFVGVFACVVLSVYVFVY